MSKNLRSRSHKLCANYDYENFYDKETGEINQQFLQDVMRPIKGFKYARAEIESGNQLEVEIYPSFRKQLPDMIKRFMSNQRKESTEARKSLNDRNSRKKLMRLVHENFYEGDYWMTLTYEKDPKDLKEAKKFANYFFRAINRSRKKEGLEKAKYVYVIEEGTYGTKRFHIHAVMDNGLSKDEVERRWIYGATNIKTMRYQGKEEDFLGITNYMSKNPEVYQKTSFRLKGARAWATSKGNLRLPEPRVNKGKYGKRKITELALNHNELIEFLISEYPQYDFKEVEVRHNDYNGLFYIYAHMQSKKRRVRR